MEQEKFNELFVEKIRVMHPGKAIESIQATDNLYELGLIDSLNMVEIIVFLESLLNHPISIENFQIRNFYTLDSIFNTFFLKSVTN